MPAVTPTRSPPTRIMEPRFFKGGWEGDKSPFFLPYPSQSFLISKQGEVTRGIIRKSAGSYFIRQLNERKTARGAAAWTLPPRDGRNGGKVRAGCPPAAPGTREEPGDPARGLRQPRSRPHPKFLERFPGPLARCPNLGRPAETKGATQGTEPGAGCASGRAVPVPPPMRLGALPGGREAGARAFRDLPPAHVVRGCSKALAHLA